LTKANLTKVRDAKPRVLASSEKLLRLLEGPKIAGLSQPEVFPRKENIMSTNLADVIVHIDETLPLDQLKTLEDHIHKIGGVVSACNRDDQPHLVTVVYNPEQVKSYDILVEVKSEGVHAELVGL
jgi:hypothetical protein